MRGSLQSYCDSFIKNRDILKKDFKWENIYLLAVCANIFSSVKKEADSEALLKCKSIVEGGTSIFSNFRGSVKLPIISMLAVSDDPENKFENALEIYGMLRKDFFGTEFLAITSMLLADMLPFGDSEKYIKRGKALYDRMNKDHPFLTSSEDSVFAVLMAFSERSDDELIARAEKAYSETKKSLSCDSNAAQTLSHILSLAEGSTEESCAKLYNIYSALKEKDRKYSKYFELSVLGGAALLKAETDDIVNDILDADAFFAGQKGYGGFGIDKKTRLMHAAMAVVNDRSHDNVSDNVSVSAMTGTLSMIATQQAAMCAIIGATAAANAAASSSH